ncbi:MAG: carboxypeptidase-like regulatory domain-containing protein [Pyrinomonadaceae bacterium]|nr:carboxypeptidase-like regulatory domain-containing protein [Pyrinomonadaceae bacterium]
MVKIFPLVFFLLSLLSSILNVSAQDGGVIKGVVRDATGAVVPNASIAFSDGAGVKTSLTNEYGEFIANLRPSNYTIKVSRLGFCDSTRPIFELTGNELVEFDFILIPCSIKNVTEYDRNSKRSSEKSVIGGPFEEKLWNICADTAKPFPMLIRYGKALENSVGSIEYRGFTTSIAGTYADGRAFAANSELPVTLYFKHETVTAERGWFFPKENRLILRGKVTWKGSGQLDQIEELQVIFCRKDP